MAEPMPAKLSFRLSISPEGTDPEILRQLKVHCIRASMSLVTLSVLYPVLTKEVQRD